MPTIAKNLFSFATIAVACVGMFAVAGDALATGSHSQGECKLVIDKFVDQKNTVPGDVIWYQIAFKNIGDADCTGTGVHVLDYVDSRLTYLSETHSSNVEFGYWGATYDTSDRSIHWNAFTLSPGEEGWVEWEAKVGTPSSCSETIPNIGYITSFEYDNFTTWIKSNTVNIQVAKNCTPPPQRPSCPFEQKANRTIVNFHDTRLLSNNTLAAAFTSVDASVPAGSYKVSLAAWDGYPERVTVTQPNERYLVKLQNGSSVLATTNATSDVPDFVASASVVEVVNNALSVPGGVNKVVAFHAVYPDTSSPNSVVPICVAFDLIPPQAEKPTCELNVNFDEIDPNEQITLSWDTTNATSFSLNQNIGGVSPVSGGSLIVAPAVSATFTGTATGPGGSVQCTVKVKVRQPPQQCNMTITKSVNKTDVKGDDTVEYTVNFKNTGTANCTGGGVHVADVVDSRLTYLSETHSGNVTAGYHGPTYTSSDRTIHWNADTLTPGEEGWVKWKGKVATPNTCSETIPNKAKVTAFELNNFNTWIESNTVNITATKNCAQTPSCPLTASGDEILVNISDSFIRSDQSESAAFKGPVSVSIPAGKYKVTLASYDDHTGHGGQNQPKESWFAILKNGNTTVGATNSIRDIGENEDYVTDVVENGLVLSSSINKVVAYHSAYPDSSSPNSVYPLCMLLKPIPPETPAPTCELNINLTEVDPNEAITLSWSTTNATTFTLDQRLGSVTPVSNGSTTYRPAVTTTFIGTATGPNGTVTCTKTVTVRTPPAPQCTLSITRSEIKTGESVKVSWTSIHSTNGTITHIGNAHPVSGGSTDDVFPSTDTTYTGTFTGPQGTTTCSANVRVVTGGCQGNCGGGYNPPNVVLYKKATDEPLVASVFLSQIPYTGFEAGTMLSIVFWLAVALFAAVVSYFVMQERGIRFFSNYLAAFAGVSWTPGRVPDVSGYNEMKTDSFASVVMEEPVRIQTPSHTFAVQNTPAPVAPAYQSQVAEASAQAGIPALADVIESRAHAAGVLMSPEAVNLAMNLSVDRSEALRIFGEILNDAVRTIPREDGWIMLTSDRLNDLAQRKGSIPNVVHAAPVHATQAAQIQTAPVASPVEETVPVVGARVDEASAAAFVGAIVSRDRETAFGIIRSLEGASVSPTTLMTGTATVLDRLYRVRHGGKNGIDHELIEKAASVTDENLHALVEIFTHSLDTVYGNPFTGVKLALAQAFDVVGV